MASKARTAQREVVAAWLTAGFLVGALAVAPSPGRDAMQNGFMSAIETGLGPVLMRAEFASHLETLRPWARDDGLAGE